jgi:hypothetical protein
MTILIVIGVVAVIAVAMLVWNSHFSPTGRNISAAHVDVDQAFQMVKVEAYKVLINHGMPGREAAAYTNEVFDPHWRTLKTNWRYLGSAGQDRLGILATTTRSCLAVIEQKYPGTIDWIATDLEPYGTDWLARAVGSDSP